MRINRIIAGVCAAAMLSSMIPSSGGAGNTVRLPDMVRAADSKPYTVHENYMENEYYNELGLALTTPDAFDEKDTSILVVWSLSFMFAYQNEYHYCHIHTISKEKM